MRKRTTEQIAVNRPFADFIKKTRKQKGLTQTEVAKTLGMTQSNLSSLEAGRCLMTLTEFVRFSERYAPEIIEKLPEELRSKYILCKL